MSKLTNWKREGIRDRAIKSAFDPRFAALTKAEDALAREAYNSLFAETERAVIAKVPARWIKRDACLRFNVGGFDITLRVEGDGLPVPHGDGYCNRLGTIPHGPLCDSIRAHANALKELNSEREKARYAVTALLNSASTINRLREIWPEGEKFFPPAESTARASLPTLRVAAVNTMLGLKAAA